MKSPQNLRCGQLRVQHAHCKWLLKHRVPRSLASPRNRGRCDNKRNPDRSRRRNTVVNLPNSITMSRIVMIPLLLWILSPHFPWQGPNGTQEILAAILFVLASITDGVDGYLAR